MDVMKVGRAFSRLKRQNCNKGFGMSEGNLVLQSAEDVGRFLDEAFPECSPLLGESQELIWHKAGARYVVRVLLACLKQQEQKEEGKGEIKLPSTLESFYSQFGLDRESLGLPDHFNLTKQKEDEHVL